MENKPKPEWRFDIIISVCAMLVSMGTFATFLYQTKIIQEDSKASVYPHLKIELKSGGIGNPYYRFGIKNVGIGPAFLKSMEIRYKNTTYSSKKFENGCLPGMFLREILSEEKVYPYHANGSTLPMVIPAGINELFLESTGSQKDMQLLMKIFDESQIKICYASVYKEYWTVVKYKQPEECKNCENEDLLKPTKK
jgi:hypothetical protein